MLETQDKNMLIVRNTHIMQYTLKFQLLLHIVPHTKARKMGKFLTPKTLTAKLGYRLRETLAHCSHSRCLEMSANSGVRHEHMRKGPARGGLGKEVYLSTSRGWLGVSGFGGISVPGPLWVSRGTQKWPKNPPNETLF